MLTGDGGGFSDGVGFHADLQRMHDRGWRVEVVSWKLSCNSRMRQWAEQNGKFIALDDFYESVTLLERPEFGDPIGGQRYPEPVDLTKRT